MYADPLVYPNGLVYQEKKESTIVATINLGLGTVKDCAMLQFHEKL